jgi:nitronate monooxygenase
MGRSHPHREHQDQLTPGMMRRTDVLARNLRLPVIAAPMFLVSGPELVLASCREGLIGAMPTLNARTTAELDEWLSRIMRGLAEADRASGNVRAGPFAANLIVHRSNERLAADIDLLEKHRVPLVMASVGDAARIVDRVHGWGGKVLADVATVHHARRAADAGADGLVLLCAGAGGNSGWLSPFAFVPAVRHFWGGTIAVAGGVAHGAGIRAALELGADLVSIGTRFIAAQESLANAGYRKMLIESTADDVVLTSEVTGIPANFLKPSMLRCGFVPSGTSGGFNTDKEIAVFKKWKDIWAAGQGVGEIRAEQSMSQIVDELEDSFRIGEAFLPINTPERL